MSLKDLLEGQRAAIAERWLARTLETYPPRTTAFLKHKKDLFANPVGQTLRSRTRAIVDELVEGLEAPMDGSAGRLCSHLEEIIRIRAVQEFTPAQAVSFVFFLKGAVRDVLASEPADGPSVAELAAVEARIDQLALFAFDIFARCRERVFELRVKEIKRTGFRLLKRANLISVDEDPAEPEDTGGSVDVGRLGGSDS